MSITDGATTAASWEVEYAHGRYLEEVPVSFVRDILDAAADAHLPGEALYIGCGNGRNVAPLADAGLDVLGLDVAPTTIAQARRRMPARADRFQVGSLDDLPSGATWPVVIGIQVFQHGTRAEAHGHLAAAAERVAPGGLLCVRVNASATDIWPAHRVVELGDDAGFTVRYTQGPKAGLAVHFFAADEIRAVLGPQFTPVRDLSLDVTHREAPGVGQWCQWEAIWRRDEA
ncbi:class I SAM-dependent methyltransferase [Oryzihumus sp.]|uniref:class I SAM-dependent methyltransferase n=1 Tax=Oryzihumus sp. TaxID=1968903 RepID=UPI002ED931D9